MPIVGGMRSEDLLRRLHMQTVRVLALVGALQHRAESRAVFEQICRSAPSARDNYRSACRARSRKEFVSRLAVALDEADETAGWLEVMRDAGLGPADQVGEMLEEASALRAILAKSWSTSSRNLKMLDAQRAGPKRPPTT